MTTVKLDKNGVAVGTSKNETISGNSKPNILGGMGGNDTIRGGGESDIIDGGTGNDRVYGDSSDDLISGGLGRDTLTGGAGRDFFAFDTKPAKSNVDTVTDFNVTYDTMMLSKAVFKVASTANGLIQSGAFWKGTKAHDSSDRIIYNDKTGAVYYDPDGSGSKAAVQFAEIGKNLKVTYKDFMIL
jgi:Ca2+-binding RTX toxin-like protein